MNNSGGDPQTDRSAGLTWNSTGKESVSKETEVLNRNEDFDREIEQEAGQLVKRLGVRLVPLHGVIDGACSCEKGTSCSRAGKHPRIASWPERASSSAASITIWVARWPGLNLGLATGRQSAVVALDIDPRNGGNESLIALEQRYGPLPLSPSSSTGGGGSHLLFRFPDGLDALPSRLLAPGVELKADGSQIVLPPSRHASGGKYEWVTGRGPLDIDPPPLSGEWLDMIRGGVQAREATEEPSTRRLTGERIKRAKAYLDTLPAAIEGEGGDLQTWTAVLVAVRGFGLPSDVALDLLMSAYNPRCIPPWRSSDLNRKITRARREGAVPWGYLLDRGDARDGGQSDESVQVPNLFETSRSQGAGAGAVVDVIEGDEDWGGVLAHDQFTNQILLLRTTPAHEGLPADRYPRAWTDEDDIHTAVWLQRHPKYRMRVRTSIVHEAIIAVADHNRIHPVRDFFGRLAWDGRPRLDGWLITYLGADDTQYVRAVGRKFLISAVARIYEPGCKVDTVLTLEGRQGIGKSSALGVLGGEWFTDEISDLGTKDAAQQVQGKLIIEMSELDAMSRSEAAKCKAFISRSTDRFRPPYGRVVREFPRQVVFAGTTNTDAYLVDSTGNRRFWPVRCGERIALEFLRRDRDQLWAEAVDAYLDGESWWLEGDQVISMAVEEQEARLVSDPWEAPIAEFVESRPEVSIVEVLNKLEVEPARQHQAELKRVAACLRRAGYERRRGTGPGRPWVYRRAN